MLPTLCDSNDPAPLPSDYFCHGGDNGAHHHVGPVPVGGQRRQLSDCQRFFSTALPWATLFWVFFQHQVYRPEDTYLLVGDEVVATKAGKQTYGLDRFFASLYGKPVPG